MGIIDTLSQQNPLTRSKSKPISGMDEIKLQIESITESVPYFDGLPAIDYDDQKENNWENVFKGTDKKLKNLGIFSKSSTKWKTYIMHRINDKDSDINTDKMKNRYFIHHFTL
jgi:hypothetical protein